MGRQALVEQRRIEIGRALEDCIIEKGSYESTSIKDIADRNGMAPGIVHHYFSSKEEILDMMVRLELRDRLNRIDDFLSSPQEERRASFDAMADNRRSNLFLFICKALSRSIDSVKVSFNEYEEELKETLANAIGQQKVQSTWSSILMMFEFVFFTSAQDGFSVSSLDSVFGNLEALVHAD